MCVVYMCLHPCACICALMFVCGVCESVCLCVVCECVCVWYTCVCIHVRACVH